MDRVIVNGRIMDPLSGRDEVGCVWIRGGKIHAITSGEMELFDQGECMDASGCWIVPGFIDLHVHLRDPGAVWKEDLESGLKAAAAGGFTTVCCMPNTKPVIDNETTLKYIDQKARKVGGPNLLVTAAMTMGQKGIRAIEIQRLMNVETRGKELLGRGICALSEDGYSLADGQLFAEIIKMAKDMNIPIFSHAEAEQSSNPEAEGVSRDLQILSAEGGSIHFCHISTEKSLELIRQAKQQGLSVTCETTPHHLALSTDNATSQGNWKMNPPLASENNRLAVEAALIRGEIDAIATDHAPHAPWEKVVGYDDAPNGIIGLETAFPISHAKVVETGIVSALDLIRPLTIGPAGVLGLDRGHLTVGGVADLTIIDMRKKYRIHAEKFQSKSRNTPFEGCMVRGQIVETLVGGRTVYKVDKERSSDD